MKRVFLCLLTVTGAAVLACSVTATPPTALGTLDAGAADSAGPEEPDVPVPAPDAEPDTARPPATTRVGDSCTATTPCSAGQACAGISQKGAAICLKTCDDNTRCDGHESCRSGFCVPTCSEGCPLAMECIADIDECIFDCTSNPSLCGPGETCSQDIQCVTAQPDAGPTTGGTCAPGGGAATSGVTGSKTVGSLSASEQATFCDWAAAVTGGYGCHGACDGGVTASFASSQADCVSKFTKPGCTATVTEVEACVKENAQDVCALKLLTSSTCATVRACS